MHFGLAFNNALFDQINSVSSFAPVYPQYLHQLTILQNHPNLWYLTISEMKLLLSVGGIKLKKTIKLVTENVFYREVMVNVCIMTSFLLCH